MSKIQDIPSSELKETIFSMDEEIDENSVGPGGELQNQNVNNNTQHVVEGTVEGEKPADSSKKKRRPSKTKRQRRWKPYYRSSWEERKEMDAREAHRVRKMGDKRLSDGQPVAPYNTTQFLMDEHEPEFDSPGLQTFDPWQHHPHHPMDTSTESTDSEYYSSPDDEEEFLYKQFTQEYKSSCAERLGTMTKDDLIHEYIAMEDRVEDLEKKLKEVKRHERELAGSDDDTEMQPGEMRMDPETAEKCRLLQAEINRLIDENAELKTENLRLSTSEGDQEVSLDSESDSQSGYSTTTDSSDESDSSDSSSSNSTSDLDQYGSAKSITPSNSVHIKTPTSIPSSPVYIPYSGTENYVTGATKNIHISTPPQMKSPS